MKKFFSLVAMMALTAVAANAETYTDVASRTDAVYIESQVVKAGETATIPVSLKSAQDAQSVGILAITLPEGMTFAEKDGALISAVANGSTHYFAAAKQSDNVLRVGINTNDGSAFAKDGVLFNVYATVDAAAVNGDYAINISGVEYSNNSTTGYTSGSIDVEDVAAKVTVTGGTGVSVVTAADAAANGTVKKVVDGNVVIETENATYSTSGAQVK